MRRRIVLFDIDGTLLDRVKRDRKIVEVWIGEVSLWQNFCKSLKFLFSLGGIELSFGICTSRETFDPDDSTWSLLFDKEDGLGEFLQANLVYVTGNQSLKYRKGLVECSLGNALSLSDIFLIDNWGDQIAQANPRLSPDKAWHVKRLNSRDSLFSLYHLSADPKRSFVSYAHVFHAGELSGDQVPQLHDFIFHSLLKKYNYEKSKIDVFLSKYLPLSIVDIEPYETQIIILIIIEFIKIRREKELLAFFTAPQQAPFLYLLINAYQKMQIENKGFKAFWKLGLAAAKHCQNEAFFTALVGLYFTSMNAFIEEQSPEYLASILASGLINPRMVDSSSLFTRFIQDRDGAKIALFLDHNIYPRNLLLLASSCFNAPHVLKLLNAKVESELEKLAALEHTGALQEKRIEELEQTVARQQAELATLRGQPQPERETTSAFQLG